MVKKYILTDIATPAIRFTIRGTDHWCSTIFIFTEKNNDHDVTWGYVSNKRENNCVGHLIYTAVLNVHLHILQLLRFG